MVPEIWSTTNRIFFSFWTIFCPFTLLTTQKTKILIQQKNLLRYHHFTQLHHKLKTYDLCFLRYREQQTEFLSSGPFFAFTPEKIQKITILKKWTNKNALRYHHFT